MKSLSDDESDKSNVGKIFFSPFQKEQKSWDKIFLSAFVFCFYLWFALMPLDAKRFGWSPEFPSWTKVIGTILFVAAFIVLFAALKENTFAAPVVKIQKERGQMVISTGVYGIARHPMYTGGLLLFTGAPLLLGSLYGLALSVLLTIFIAFRAVGEERMLWCELDGYDEYMKKVRWRLVPFIF